MVRKIRNEFAHNIKGCNFEESRIKSRVDELAKSTCKEILYANKEKPPKTTREKFLYICSWLLWSICKDAEECCQLKEADIEFGYLSEKDE